MRPKTFFTLFCLLNKMNERVVFRRLFFLRKTNEFLLHICYSCEIRTNVEKTKRKGRGRSSVPQRNEQSATASGSGSRRWSRPQRVKQFDIRKRKRTRLRIKSRFFSLWSASATVIYRDVRRVSRILFYKERTAVCLNFYISPRTYHSPNWCNNLSFSEFHAFKISKILIFDFSASLKSQSLS